MSANNNLPDTLTADERIAAVTDRWTWLTIEGLRVPALWDGQTRWNGYPSPQLPKWIAYLVGEYIETEPAVVAQMVPHIENTDESALVAYDGIAWEEHADDAMHTCPRCGSQMLAWEQADHDRDCPITYADRAYQNRATQRKADRVEHQTRNRKG